VAGTLQLTIRGLPPEIEEGVRKEARQRRTSLNKAVIQLLEKALGRSRPDKSSELHYDLDRFSGAWSAEETAELEGRLLEARTIDKELWE
jgi:hypothetical protein